jgi:hypothetical protein
LGLGVYLTIETLGLNFSNTRTHKSNNHMEKGSALLVNKEMHNAVGRRKR